MTKKVTRQDMSAAAEKYKNWGKWGPDDEIGTLNFTTPEDIIAATKLVKKGKVISLALNFDNYGPQGAKSKYPMMGRINPVHTMLRTGTDAIPVCFGQARHPRRRRHGRSRCNAARSGRSRPRVL